MTTIRNRFTLKFFQNNIRFHIFQKVLFLEFFNLFSCRDDTEELCHTNTEELCHTNTEELCHTNTEELCHTNTEELCHTNTEELCHTNTEELCHTNAPSSDCKCVVLFT